MMQILNRMTNGLLTLLAILLIATIALSVYNVVSRYIFNSALLWADEIAVFAMITMAWFGAVVCGWQNAEIKMDILIEALPPQYRRGVGIVQQALIAVLCIWVAWQSLPFVTRAYTIGMRSDASGFPLWVIHAVIPLSLLLIALIASLRFFSLIVGRGTVFAAVPTKAEPTP